MSRLLLAGYVVGCIAEGAFYWVLLARVMV